MRITTDEEMIARQGRLGQATNFIALVVVIGGLIVSFTPWKVITIVLVGVGVVMYTIGNRGLGQVAREPRHIQQVTDALKSFDDRYRLYNHVLPGDHVLLTPHGVFVLVLKGVDGRIRCFKDRWVRDLSLRRVLGFFTDEPLGNPTKDAQREARQVQKYMDEHSPEAGVEVQGLVVFVNPAARLEVTSASLPVVPLRRLRTYVRKASQEEDISSETLAALTALFDEAPRT